ncbi:hypothetical protein FACS189429_4110 [Bacteroidia bacterium]|nr:hypothetical protein FACS189429_4110 [Bacteroidia bacterium]
MLLLLLTEVERFEPEAGCQLVETRRCVETPSVGVRRNVLEFSSELAGISRVVAVRLDSIAASRVPVLLLRSVFCKSRVPVVRPVSSVASRVRPVAVSASRVLVAAFLPAVVSRVFVLLLLLTVFSLVPSRVLCVLSV